MENGIIIKDKECRAGARITIEICANKVYAITCGIYGWTCHTMWYSNDNEAQKGFQNMQADINNILQIMPCDDDPKVEEKMDVVSDHISDFIDKYS